MDRQQKIVEDAPQMRSMQVMSAMPIISRHSEPLAKAAPIRASTAKPVVQGAAVWKLNEGDVMPLPSIYMLERTHVKINASVNEVTKRIAECLQRESICATYNSQEALVEAETRENVRFTIRLWKEASGGLIVEVQKMDGCCFMYCQAAKAILRSAKGQAPQTKRQFALPSCVPRDAEDIQKACIESGLEVASEMLKKDRIDSHMMAIDTLLHISKATQAPAFAAHCILCGEFCSTLLSLVESFRICQSQAETPLGEFEKQNVAMMHRNALTIIANCLNALADARQLGEVLGQHEELSAEDFLAALVEDITDARARPHDACEAARCLRPLMNESKAIRSKLLALGASDAVESAVHEGACRHALLESVTTKLRVQL